MKVSASRFRACLVELLSARLALAKRAADEAKQAATDAESAAETKWDTFGLESSYLAHGQSERVLSAQQDLQFGQNLSLSSSDVVMEGCLFCLSFTDLDRVLYFISSRLGGLELTFDNEKVTLISVRSPVGSLLLGKEIGDEVEVMRRGQKMLAEVMDIVRFVD